MSAPTLALDEKALLKRKLRKAESKQRFRAYALILPLFVFTLLTFLVPIGLMLFNSAHDPVVHDTLPRTSALLEAVPEESSVVPDELVFEALAADIKQAVEEQTASKVASRLNYEESGLRTMFMKTARRISQVERGPWKPAFLQIDKAWGEPKVWSVLRQTSGEYTGNFYLHAADMTRDDQGDVVRAAPDDRLYIDVFMRTMWVSLLVTLLSLAIGYPLSFWLAHLPAKTSNLMMVLVLLPFWTSLLVRTTAWVVLLQKEGVVNSILMAVGLIDDPMNLIFNRLGVVIAMTHILLPFMILPLYSVMRQIPPSYVRAARSLGAGPFTAFWRVYFPQSLAGISAGVLLVFILALGYYITPALVGGAGDQMMSYFIADHLTRSLNWGLASALGGLLLVSVLILYALYERFVGIANVRLG